MRSPQTLLTALAVWMLAPGAAFAADLSFEVNAEGAASHLVGEYKSTQFGWGATGLVAPELRFGKVIGIELPLGIIGLTQASRQDPAYMPSTSGAAYFAMPGLRIRPFAARWGDPLWIAGGGGFTDTGGMMHPSVDLRAGLNLHLGRFDIGPFGGLIQVLDTTSGVRSQDARLVVFGIHAAASPFAAKELVILPPKDAVAVKEFEKDRDGIPEAMDACPDESDSDSEAPDGCEHEVRVVGDSIQLDDRVLFEIDQSKILVARYSMLQKVAALLKDHSEYEKILITGHADDTGDDAYNMKLSEARARSVRAFLISAGVGEGRFAVAFFGKRRPRVVGQTFQARKQNRRVEFTITERREVQKKKKAADPPPLEPRAEAPQAAGGAR
jgi:outer membrane protein OmpA-like peptidoglycan-associated protein